MQLNIKFTAFKNIYFCYNSYSVQRYKTLIGILISQDDLNFLEIYSSICFIKNEPV